MACASSCGLGGGLLRLPLALMRGLLGPERGLLGPERGEGGILSWKRSDKIISCEK